MLLKPSLDDLPIEKELKEELDINTKKVKASNRSVWFGFLVWLVVYSLVVYFSKMSIELAWVIGVPLFLILGILFAISTQLYQINLSNNIISEYFSKHIIFRLEEINKTVEENNKKWKKFCSYLINFWVSRL